MEMGAATDLLIPTLEKKLPDDLGRWPGTSDFASDDEERFIERPHSTDALPTERFKARPLERVI